MPEERYRFTWYNAIYEPGEVKVVAYDKKGNIVDEKSVRTSGQSNHIELLPSRTVLSADGKDLVYITLRVVDKYGNLCPHDNSLVTFDVKGAGIFRASANGDPTCLDLFHLPQMHAFNGMLTAIVQSGKEKGTLELQVTAKGVKSGKIQIEVVPQ